MLGNHLTLRSRGRLAFVVGAIAVGLALTGCDSGSGEGSADAASSEPVESSSAGPTNTYEVEAGDTLSGIAAGYGLSLSELVDANEWTDGSDHAIFPGDVIALPADAVAVSTTRPAVNDDDDGDDDDSTSAGPSATTTAAPTSGGYTPGDGESYAGPALEGRPTRSPTPWPTACIGHSVRPSAGTARRSRSSWSNSSLATTVSNTSEPRPTACLSDIDFVSAHRRGLDARRFWDHDCAVPPWRHTTSRRTGSLPRNWLDCSLGSRQRMMRRTTSSSTLSTPSS